jgi:hypothetical protein
MIHVRRYFPRCVNDLDGADQRTVIGLPSRGR